MSRLLKNISPLPLYFGGASISGEGGGYGFGDISEDMAIELLVLAVEKGIKIFDTAPIYGFGSSERRMGRAFKKIREKVFIVSKSGVTWHTNKRVDMTNDPKVTQKMLEQSLRDLNSEYIDLYMIHWPDKLVDIRKPMEILAQARLQGKIKHIGLCNTHQSDLERAMEIDRVEVVQSQFNLFERDAINLFDYLTQQNISFMSWGTLDKGILTGRVDKKRRFDASDCRSWAPWWKQMDKNSRYQKLEKIKPLLKKYGVSNLELALGHNLNFPQVDGVLCGARTEAQLLGLCDALKKLPSKDFLEEILKIITEGEKLPENE